MTASEFGGASKVQTREVRLIRRTMFSPESLTGAVGALAPASSSRAAVWSFPPDFRVEDIATDGASIHVRVGGKGPAVVLLHGFGETGDMWAPMAAALVMNHTVLAPDLRGMGLSSHPEDGYDKKTQARDVAHVMGALHIENADLVTHDIGNMVGYALAAQHPERVTKWVVIDAPPTGDRALGRDRPQPNALALQFPRARRRAARCRPRAHLSRSVLERTLCQPGGHR
jgi:pimeloyl-ACP methyl ester carboxylesterase